MASLISTPTSPADSSLPGEGDASPPRSAPLRRRIGPSIALVGPDGAGKTTTAAGIVAAWPGQATTVYLGLGAGFTSPRPGDPKHVPGLSAILGIGMQWQRWAGALVDRCQGRLVVFDRYSEDAWLPDVRTGRAARIGRRLRSLVACPSPDLLVVLDAPGDVMFARKGELDPRTLEAERQRYLDLAQSHRAFVVDSTRPSDEVVAAVLAELERRSRGER